MSSSKRVWTVLSMLEWATGYFEEKNVHSPRMSIEWLLADVLQVKRLDLYLQYDRPLSVEELDKIRPMVKRRASHEPLQYITGYTDFMSATFRVTPDVLIPRPETEQLVEIVLEQFRDQSTAPVSLLDIGTGSGCIPVSIKKTYTEWYCAGMDISAKALQIARENAAANETKIDFFEADLLNIQNHSDISGRNWDIIISNPPYITNDEKDALDPQVIDFEPALALFHDSPVILYKKIAEFAASQKASLFLEINNSLVQDIHDTIASLYKTVNQACDLDGNKRFIIAGKPV
ncbi:MAG: peptide chain release factor N(5)-glutamine methyltransferase [Balneolaceae bacterium]